jgi:hypothetical protein
LAKVTIDYIERDGEITVLLDAKTRARHNSFVQARTAEAEKLRSEELKNEAIQAELEVLSVQREMALDEELRGKHEVKTCVIEFRDGTIEDYDRISDMKDLTLAKIARECYKTLAPQIVSGYEGPDIPMKMYGLVADACFSSVFPELSDERKLFLG